MSGRQIVLGALLVLLLPAKLESGAAERRWQDGELLSRKTISVGRTLLEKRYVYRIRGFNCRYLVVSDTALRLDLYMPMKFSTDRRHVIIQDVDGQERKVSILQRADFSHR